ERQFAARQRGGQAVVGSDGPVPPSSSERMILPLRPLFIVVAGLAGIAAAGLGWQRINESRR
ncbi:MAG: hypothetical protein KDB23_31660, partial [Planctomycetales bacterium]|nr:hypothetical protein [Planctomycetales bacterium]